MAYECFKVSVKDHIATVLFDRPPVNAKDQRAFVEKRKPVFKGR